MEPTTLVRKVKVKTTKRNLVYETWCEKFERKEKQKLEEQEIKKKLRKNKIVKIKIHE